MGILVLQLDGVIEEAVGDRSTRRNRQAVVLVERSALLRRHLRIAEQLFVVAGADVATVILVEVAEAVVDEHVRGKVLGQRDRLDAFAFEIYRAERKRIPVNCWRLIVSRCYFVCLFFRVFVFLSRMNKTPILKCDAKVLTRIRRAVVDVSVEFVFARRHILAVPRTIRVVNLHLQEERERETIRSYSTIHRLCWDKDIYLYINIYKPHERLRTKGTTECRQE